MDVPVSTWRRAIAVSWVVMITNTVAMWTVGAPPGYIEMPTLYGVGPAAVFCSVMNGVRGSRDRKHIAAAKAEQDAKAELERRWRAEVYRVKVADPAPGQCPVCGMDDLPELIQRDAFLHVTGEPGARAVAYGAVFAHAECAQIAPYATMFKGTTADLHLRGFHHGYALGNTPGGCVGCIREDKAGAKDPIDPPVECTCVRCKPPQTDARRDTTISTARYAHRPGTNGVYMSGCIDCMVMKQNPDWRNELYIMAGSPDPWMRNRAWELIARMKADDQWPDP